MRLALYQPEIPGNVGAILRLGACFDVGVDLIGPIGFPLSDARLRRSAMDYIDLVAYRRHTDFDSFAAQAQGRLILLTTRGGADLYETAFAPDDILLFGSESAGVPDQVAARCVTRVRIAIAPAVRSLNLSVAAAIALAEALRQTKGPTS